MGLAKHSDDAPVISRRDLLRALNRPTQLHFQAIVDLTRGVVTGYETLARFRGPPQASPDRWFAAAAEHGLGLELEIEVWRAALQVIDNLPPNCFLTINATPELLISDPFEQLMAGRSSLEGVVVEVTEHSVIEDYSALNERLAPLKARGAAVAVDDAGAGYASLTHILALRPQFVKLDRYFVDGCHLNPAKAAVVEMVGKFAGRIDAWLLTEGIEKQEELDLLVGLGVPLGQGYLLAKPESGWVGMDARVRDSIRGKALAAKAGALIASVIEVAPAMRAGTQLSVLPNDCDYTVQVDASQRPLSVCRAGSSPIEALKVKANSTLSDVLRRAMMRPGDEAFAPVICINEEGEYVGIARIERLVDALARQKEA